MIIFIKNYALFGFLVSLVVCVCVNSILWLVVKRRSYGQLAWLVPMALGYTISFLIGALYAFNAQYWGRLAQSGSYPLIIIGFFGGLLMIYGWLRFTLAFFKDNQLQYPIKPEIAGNEDGTVWPPAPRNG